MVIYFSGTGNSRYVAKMIAALTNDKLCDSSVFTREGLCTTFQDPGTYVFVAPVYVSAPPKAFLDFIRYSEFPSQVRAYFVMTCAGGMGGSPGYCLRMAHEKGFVYLGTAQIVMPQNYIAFFQTQEEDNNIERVEQAQPVIEDISKHILNRATLPDSGMKAWEYLSTKLILDMYYKGFMKTKSFFSTDSCIGCGHCAAVCPLGNIKLTDKRPVWGENCTHCMACINLCPKNAIEYGKWARGKPRYKGPEKSI